MNKQLVFGVIAVVLASTLIATLAVDSVFAQHNQRIHQHNHASQSATVVTAGAGSTITGSGNNVLAQTATNNGGNAAVS